MKPWHSVSARLTLTLLGLTLGSLIGLSMILDTALNKFFIQDAQEILQRQADVLAAQAKLQRNNTALNQWVHLTSTLR